MSPGKVFVTSMLTALVPKAFGDEVGKRAQLEGTRESPTTSEDDGRHKETYIQCETVEAAKKAGTATHEWRREDKPPLNIGGGRRYHRMHRQIGKPPETIKFSAAEKWQSGTGGGKPVALGQFGVKEAARSLGHLRVTTPPGAGPPNRTPCYDRVVP